MNANSLVLTVNAGKCGLVEMLADVTVVCCCLSDGASTDNRILTGRMQAHSIRTGMTWLVNCTVICSWP